MNWDAIGAIGQLLGSVAVFVTLGYLAVQVRHARQETRRALSQGRGEGFRDMMTYEIDPRLSGIAVKAAAALGGLTFPPAVMERSGLDREEMRLMFWKEYGWWMYRVQLMAHADDLSAMERHMFDSAVRNAYGQRGLSRLFYEEIFKTRAHPDTVRYVENLLAQPG
jgi:hypothetical protein